MCKYNHEINCNALEQLVPEVIDSIQLVIPVIATEHLHTSQCDISRVVHNPQQKLVSFFSRPHCDLLIIKNEEKRHLSK